MYDDKKTFKKYLMSSLTTPDGRMKQPQIGIRSTSKQQRECEEIDKEPVVENVDIMELNFLVPTEGHVIPDDKKANSVFCCVALADTNTGKIQQARSRCSPWTVTRTTTRRIITTHITLTHGRWRTSPTPPQYKTLKQ